MQLLEGVLHERVLYIKEWVCINFCLGLFLFLLIFFFWYDWGLNSGVHVYKAGTLLLEPQLQSILLWLFSRWSFTNYLPRLASNSNPLISASQVARIIDMSYQSPAIIQYVLGNVITSRIFQVAN
jgi:hypothetical protein